MRALVMAASLAFGGGSLHAQPSLAVQPGQRVRFLGMAVIGGIGEVAGFVVGLKRRTERWERVERPESASRVSIAPVSSRGLAFRVSF